MLRGNGSPSCARCCRSSITALRRGSTPTPVHPGTFPDVLGDGGVCLLRFQVGKPRTPHRDRVAPARSHKGMYASVVQAASCATAPTSGNSETVWSWKQELR